MNVLGIIRKKAGSLKVTLRRSRYAKYYKHLDVDRNVVLYDSYFGRGFICNPYALFLALKNDPEFQHMKHIWVLDSDDIQNPMKDDACVITVKRHSKAHLKALASAGYLITNVSMPYYYCKKPEQIYAVEKSGLRHSGFCGDDFQCPAQFSFSGLHDFGKPVFDFYLQGEI